VITWSAHLGTLFGELPPLDRPAAARAAGFRVLEAWWPPAPDPDVWVAAVRAAGMRATLVNADGGDLAAGERGYCTDPARRTEVVAAARAAARVVAACGGTDVNLLVGRDDGVRPAEAQWAAAVEAVRAAADAVAGEGVRILIEHLNAHDVAGPLLPTPAAAAAFVEDVRRPAVRLLFDAYHAARMDLDPVDEAARVTPLIGHVQYADSPGRGAPGTGGVDLGRFVEALAALGYRGAVGLEFVPAGPTPAALTALPGLSPHAGFGGDAPQGG